MQEMMYGLNSVLIAAVLFVSLAVAIEVGYQIGRRIQDGATESTKAHINAMQASLLGVLALLLGFTFSQALQRFDRRSEAVVEEANAIGTAWLRAHLLPSSVRDDVRERLRRYLDLRVEAGRLTLVEDAERAAVRRAIAAHHDLLWERARQAAEEDRSPVTSGLFIQALNELIDSYGRREAALARHVPEVVLLLLFGTFTLTGSIVGYGAGVAGHRASFVTYVMVALIVLLVFIIIDLDRPRRGLIAVSQQSLTDLQAALATGEGRPASPAAPSPGPP